MIDAVHRHPTAHRALLGQPLPTLRVIEIQEEAGEVAEALLGVLGADPRKGVSHTVADLRGEHCEVITAAVVTLRDTTPDPAAVLTAHLAAWHPGRTGAAGRGGAGRGGGVQVGPPREGPGADG
ncbi:MazG-like family protein [Kitasatospora sp. NPDC059599]|uniref:MazG-like family protein n=1 Tax=Kitasatospora sp. NPDC059599 TaxID=3346880 RepID=UPI0036C9AE08